MKFRNLELKKIEPKAIFISYTFSKDCSNIYTIVQYNDGLKDIFKYDISTGDYIQLTHNLHPKFISINDNPQPDPFFIYTINNEKLLVSFITPTTGFDGYTNFTIHQIYNLTSNTFSKTIDFINPDPTHQPYDWLLPSALLDFKHNILSNVVAINYKQDSQSNITVKALVRKDFDLVSEQFIKTVSLNQKPLKDPMNELFFECPPAIQDPNEYAACWQKNYHNIFPDNTQK